MTEFPARKATIEVEWRDDNELVPALLQRVLDALMTELLATDGVVDPSISATLDGATFDVAERDE